MAIDLSALNEDQLRAVLTTEGPVLVLAGPGSGKTRVTTTRVAHLVDQGLDPAGVVAITFTNKAAAEMRHRVGALLPAVRVRDMWVTTFHSMCLRMLRASVDLLDVGRFTIFDEDAVKSLFRGLLRDLELNTHPIAKGVRRKISEAKNNLVGVNHYHSTAETEEERIIAAVYREYHDRLRAQHGLDFDDLIFETIRLLAKHPGVLSQYRNQFHHLHVDEYQDTNYAQYRLINLLAGPNIMVVGDDDQSIYGFRGSDPRNIGAFLKDRPTTAIISLGHNYRSSDRIVTVTSTMIAKNPHRNDKNLRTENAPGVPVRIHGTSTETTEAQFVVAEILSLLQGGREPGDFAILYRTGAQSRVLETHLLRNGIPHMVVRGNAFFDRAEVKDSLALLRVAAGPDNDVALTRILTSPLLPRRGIGKGTLKKAAGVARSRGIGLEETLRELHSRSSSGATHKALGKLLHLLDELRLIVSSEPSLGQIVSKVLERFGVIEALENAATEGEEDRIPNVLEIANLASEFKAGLDPDQVDSLHEFLDWLALLQGEFTGGSKGRITSTAHANAVCLMTAHASKGLEFPVVFVVGVEEEYLPHYRAIFGDPDNTKQAIMEERRLAYVAMTRAKQLLYLIFAARRALNGTVLERHPSRFLQGLPEEHIKRTGVSPSAPSERRPWARQW